MDIAISKNGVLIRLTAESWQHNTVGHPEMADFYFEILETVENPDIIYEGNYEALIAIKKFDEPAENHIVVICKEVNPDGFILTAYMSSKQQRFQKKKIVWEPKK